MTRRKDGLWQEVLTINGKKKYFYGHSKADVIAKISAYKRKLVQSDTFRSVAQSWESVHREEIGAKTWMNYEPHYKDMLERYGDLPVTQITALDIIKDLKRTAAEGYSATIVRTRRSLFRMILDHAVIGALIPYNCAIGIELPKCPKPKRRTAPDTEVLQIILENTDKPFGLFPALLALTGLRKAEALALTWGDIKEDHIVVNKALDYTVHAHPVVKPPKTEAGDRLVPILSALRPLLKRPAKARPHDLVFPSTPSNRNPTANGYIPQREYEGLWKRYCTSVGLVDDNGKPTLTAHQLRHAMATMGFEAGVDELTMQAILGHASPNTTRDIYTHLRQSQRVKSVEKLDEKVQNFMQKSPNAAELQEK